MHNQCTNIRNMYKVVIISDIHNLYIKWHCVVQYEHHVQETQEVYRQNCKRENISVNMTVNSPHGIWTHDLDTEILASLTDNNAEHMYVGTNSY